MKIIDYRGTCDIDVEFENGVIRRNVTYQDFNRGCLIAVDYSKRVGESVINTYGSKITVIDYKNSDNVYVEFDNGYKTKCTWNSFSKGSIKSPYCKTLHNIGYLGEGKYNCDNIWYNHWRAMIERVHIKNDNFHRTYSDVTIYENWYNYQIFSKWSEQNYYEIPNMKMQLDKDILIKGNRIYSPETCVFVPYIINALLLKSDKMRGNLPIGVYWHERDQEYRSQCSFVDYNGKRKNKWLGGYSNPEDAFIAYKIFKELYIKEVADKYKEYIPKNLYKALYKYEVEITD